MGSETWELALGRKAAWLRALADADGPAAAAAPAAPVAPQPTTMARIANRLIKRFSQPELCTAQFSGTIPQTSKDANRNTVPEPEEKAPQGGEMPQIGPRRPLGS